MKKRLVCPQLPCGWASEMDIDLKFVGEPWLSQT